MKFDKKVMESGMVVTFSLALTLSSVCGTNFGTRTQLSSQAVELTAEPVRYFDRTEGAMAAALAAAEKAIAQKEASQLKVAVAEGKKAAAHKEASGLDKIKGTVNDSNIEGQPQVAKSEQKDASQAEDSVSSQGNPSQADTVIMGQADAQDVGTDAGQAGASVAGTGTSGQEGVAVAKEESHTEPKEEAVPSQEGEGASQAEGSIEVAGAKVEMLKTENEEVSPWASKLLPDVEEYLNIRTEPSDEAELAGKLYKGDLAKVVEKGDTWIKISSGDVEGYVKNEFCVTGLEAETLANEVGTAYAIASTGGVRVRAEASSAEDIGILDVMEEGGKLEVDTEAAEVEGWIAVKTEEGSGYVSADYVDKELELGRAISIEEEMAAIAAAEAAEAEKARQEQAAQQGGGSVSQRGAVSASYDDLTLLGALIQCEAGGEPYEGQLAVGAVVMNRLRAGYAGSISGVIYQSGQFTPASSGALASVLASGSISGSCMQAAQEAINGVSNVGGALSFRRATPGCGGIVIGNHMFF